MKKVKKACSYCGSDDVMIDSYAKWNNDTQQWEHYRVSDSGGHCNTCEGECTIITKPLRLEDFLDFHEEGKDIDSEVWIHKETGELYTVPVERIRYFDQAELK